MSEEFGTVSIRRGAGAREIEVLRGQYRQHRDSLLKLITDAPTEHLAIEYQKLVRDIDSSLSKLDELEERTPTAPGTGPRSSGVSPETNPAFHVPTPVPSAVPPRGTAPGVHAHGDPLRAPTEPGARQLIPPPGQPDEQPSYESAPSANGSRLLLIVIAAIVVLGAIGALIWRASSERKATQITSTAPVVETTPTVAPVTPAPKTAGPLSVAPEVVDFGTVAKGTRAARQLEVANSTTAPVAIEVSRSQCRCLYYEYAKQVGPKGKETVTVTVDGARAKPGALDETITVKSKKDPTVVATFQVSGTIK